MKLVLRILSKVCIFPSFLAECDSKYFIAPATELSLSRCGHIFSYKRKASSIFPRKKKKRISAKKEYQQKRTRLCCQASSSASAFHLRSKPHRLSCEKKKREYRQKKSTNRKGLDSVAERGHLREPFLSAVHQ